MCRGVVASIRAVRWLPRSVGRASRSWGRRSRRWRVITHLDATCDWQTRISTAARRADGALAQFRVDAPQHRLDPHEFPFPRLGRVAFLIGVAVLLCRTV